VLLLEKLQKDFIDHAKIISIDSATKQPKKSSEQKKRMNFKPYIKPFNHVPTKKIAKMVERILKPTRSTRNQEINQRIVERIFKSQKKSTSKSP